MSDQNPHKEAQTAIRWLQSYFKSLKAWIRELDGTIIETHWIPFEMNRISTVLGNGYQDNTEWVLNWITRHYYQVGSNKTLFVYLPLATYKTNDETDVFTYFMCCEHNALVPEEGVPTYGKDWVLGSPVIEFLRSREAEIAFETETEVTDRTFRDASRLRVMKIPMTVFGSDTATVRDVVAKCLAIVAFP